MSADPSPNGVVIFSYASDNAPGSNFTTPSSSFAGTSGSGNVDILTTDDTVDEPDGGVTFRITSGNGYTIGSPSSATVMVMDDDPTVVSLARVGSGDVVEGNKVEFTVTLGRALIAGEIIDVPLSISGTGVTTGDWSLATKSGMSLNTGVTLRDTGTSTPKVRFSGAGAQTATLELTATADGVSDNGETFTIALGPDGAGANGFDVTSLGTNVGGGADPDSTANTFNVTVNDPGTIPEITITAGTSPVTEGTAASFTVNASLALSANLDVSLTVTQSGSFAASGATGANKTVRINANATSATYTVATVNDNADESNGSVTVMVTGGSGYTVGSTASASVTVNDDDIPILTVSGGAAVTEGINAIFTVTSSHEVINERLVGVSVVNTPGSDFTLVLGRIQGFLGVRQAVNVATINDTVDEADGGVTLTISSRTGYMVGNPSMATVTVKDNDPTVVSLAKVGSATAINEGQKVEFTVTLGRALVVGEIIDAPLSISGTGVTTGDWSLAKKSGGSLNTGVTLQDTGTATPKVRFSGAGAQTATLELTATDDSTSEGSETINVALGPDGTGANGFDHTSLGTNVGGGADPHGANNDFDITITTQDTTAPRVTSITRQTPSTSPTNADTLTWRVTFNEAVQNVNAADFQVSGTNATLAVAPVGSNNAYDVTASGGNLANLDATVTLSFASGQDIEDASGNTLANTTPTGSNNNTFEVINTQVTVKFSATDDSVNQGDELFWYGVSEGDGVIAGITLSEARSTATAIRIGMQDLTATGQDIDFDSSPITITVPAGQTSATGTIQTVEDNLVEEDETFAMLIIPPLPFGVTTVAPSSSYVTIENDDTAAVNVSPTSVSVSEASGAGRTRTYTVVLATQPPATRKVTITPTSSDSGAATVSPASLTFDSSSWNTAQTVTVTAVDDNVDNPGNRRVVTVRHSATSSDPNYNGINIPSVTATVVDNDGAGLSINETGTPQETRVTEAGSGNTDSYTVMLDTQPTGSVAIVATSGDPAAATVSPATLTFTTGDYNTLQTVTVTGVDDNTDNPGGGREVSISHRASSTDDKYTFASGGTVEAMVSDDDATTVTLSGAAGNMEEGETKEFTITLGRGLVDGETLTAPLTFGGTATRGTDYTMTGSSATGVQYNNLNSGNARVVFTGPQTGATATRATITLRATADNTAESPAETVNIGLGTITNTGLSNFGGVTETDSLGQFTIADETPAGVAITESGGSTSVTEAAGTTNTDTYTVVLKSQPTATVTITVESGDPGAATVSPATLIFTTSNWDTAQMVTVTGVDDSVPQSGGRSVAISHSATSTDAKYNGNTISIPNVTATVVDDDNTPSALPAVEFTAAAYSGGEASGNRIINVALRATPAFTAATTVSYRVSGTATAGEDFTPLPGTVSMTGGAGTVPITILEDQIADDGETIILTLTAANGYTVGTQGSATITIADDDDMTPPPSTLPVVSIAGGGGVINEGEEASFTVTATPAPPPGATISVNVRISDSGDFASSGQTGSRSVTIDASGAASFIVTTEDDTTQEEDGRITATVQRGPGYTPHGTTASASVTVIDDEVVRLSTPSLRVAAGGSASYQVALDDRPTGDVTVTIRVGSVNGEGGAAPSSDLSPPATSPWDGANTMEGETAIRVHPATLTFTPTNWDREQPVTLTVAEEGDLMGAAITLTHTANGGGHVDVSTTMTLTVVAAHSTEEAKAWHLRLGRTLSHQVVTALQERWSTPPATGLQLTVAGETVPSATALAEHEGLLTKALGFETVTPQALVEGSSFSLAPGPEGGAPHLAFWGQGAFSSFSGEQETLSLDGEMTTLLLGADWHTEQWQAGAALSHSWGNGSYDGDNGADGEITSTVTGLFPYGRYALTPRLGLWAVAGHGWGQLSLKPDGEDEAKPNTTMGMVAVGLDGVLLHGGSEGITLTTTADVLTLKTTSAEVDGLESSEGSLSRRRVGLEAVRPFPLSNGASLLPSMALGIRHDSGDAEAGYGLDLGVAIRWQAPKQGISGELKGHTLLTHTEESLQDQGLALSFSWQPHPSNRGPSLSLSHTMGATAAGGMDTLLHPTTMEGLDTTPGNGQRLTAELAYGFPAHNDHITLTPAVALALSPASRNYGLLWSVAPYPEQLQGEPWELSLAGERQEQNTAISPVEHSLKLTFSTLF